jgi:hypothetical protein
MTENTLNDDIIAAYESANPTPENTTEIVAQIAEEFGKTVNGVRLILSKAGVYVKKAPTVKSGEAKAAKGEGATRVKKADVQAELTNVIEGLGFEPDGSMIEKMTGKACQYFIDILKNVERAAR